MKITDKSIFWDYGTNVSRQCHQLIIRTDHGKGRLFPIMANSGASHGKKRASEDELELATVTYGIRFPYRFERVIGKKQGSTPKNPRTWWLGITLT
ncbi:MAG: hypothetical protein K8F91_11765 [Candidatus Obscuribacterales bacterium]|nr:hypothetical protein [Candidatus Obscuribacterales bacterium]